MLGSKQPHECTSVPVVLINLFVSLLFPVVVVAASVPPAHAMQWHLHRARPTGFLICIARQPFLNGHLEKDLILWIKWYPDSELKFPKFFYPPAVMGCLWFLHCAYASVNFLFCSSSLSCLLYHFNPFQIQLKKKRRSRMRFSKSK